jgi:hypothetical protein
VLDPAPRIVSFLQDIGLDVRAMPLDRPTFLPGVTIDSGGILFDPERLLYPGDLLHEAGHLAVLTPDVRRAAHGDEVGDGGMEMGAIAWSYAAALHLGLDPTVVFHAAGYKGGAESLLENFKEGRYIGVPILEWAGMTAASPKAQALGPRPYPHMLRWLREN